MAFTLHIFESEFREIIDFVSSYPNIETGGDLFGLWKASGDPVVQLIIGPGRKCRRTSVSFHQDTDYLARVGTYVNTNFMLCHIGSWHSHHQLSLTQPSAGDRSTVCNNFPKGLKRYIMIIANITRGGSSRQPVVINPYMFTNEGHVCKLGKVSIISWGNPFREIGFVLTQIAKGAEPPPTTKEAYSSRAPSGYHNRPSTQSKPISAAPVQAININNQSHSPPKVDRNLKQPSTSRYLHDEPTPMHQNYFSNNSTPEPMEVDPPDYRIVTQQQSTKSQHTVTESNDTKQPTQWYETEEGGAILKEIHKEIDATMSDNISYSRDQFSKNLTMEFTHDNQKWTINFPRLFRNKPAIICNPRNGKSVSSRSVVEDIRQACCCNQCRSKKTYHQHSPSRDNHPLPPSNRDHSPSRAIQSPPPYSHSKNVQSPKKDLSSPSKEVRHASRHGRFSPYGKRSPQPWYDTDIGKSSVQKIKSDIETYLKTDHTVGRVETMNRVTSKGRSKRLSFSHNYHGWIIEFVSLKKDHVELKIDRNGEHKYVTTLQGPPYDVVRDMQKHCLCIKCTSPRRSPSAGQRRQGSAFTRPNSRYVDHVRSHSPTRAASTSKFFDTEKGEEKFRSICTEISSLFLRGRNVEIRRLLYSKGIVVEFEHNRRRWKITFPFMFPQAPPKLEDQNGHQFHTVSGRNDVLRTIRKNCECSSCERYNYY